MKPINCKVGNAKKCAKNGAIEDCFIRRVARHVLYNEKIFFQLWFNDKLHIILSGARRYRKVLGNFHTRP